MSARILLRGEYYRIGSYHCTLLLIYTPSFHNLPTSASATGVALSARIPIPHEYSWLKRRVIAISSTSPTRLFIGIPCRSRHFRTRSHRRGCQTTRSTPWLHLPFSTFGMVSDT
ncbi:hypothetical protein CY34DRAFT_504067 [Suillus luteus UH-Slu-Lm8-n1]|uniref:Unplaced genomic scaffold CY34scaffold_381, whole genome shotgun sequence n=1 Tax=Suillus luteus UH-Slu-Lm8-n1 TaxID=930992 RepID=A0A0D0AQT0_9AGAM|nr:hypothetical protein CY34DRAFT_504067 [Suillus luteus UH-Slu-Lm8-n1]